MTFDPRRTPWLVDESEFYELETRRQQLEFLLRYAVLAPSGHNTQPWSFHVVDEGIEVSADLTRRLGAIDAANRELYMSVGAAITNLRVAAAHFGFETTALYSSAADAPVCALVAIRETCCPDSAYSRLFPGITKRRTNRQPYSDRPIDETSLAKLCDFIDDQTGTIRFVLPHDRQRTTQLVAEANGILMANPQFRDELTRWMRPNETELPDGVCGDGFGFPGPLSALAPVFVRNIDVARLAENASGILVVTADDDRMSLIRAGEALERLLLLLTTLGIQYSFLNQPAQVDPVRRELWSMIRSAKPPQVLVRIGYAAPVRRPMPRRPLDAVIS